MSRSFLGGRLAGTLSAAAEEVRSIDRLLVPARLHFLPPLPGDGSDSQITLYRHADGLASEVYRALLPSKEIDDPTVAHATSSRHGASGTLGVKRVTLEDQPRPHDVARELRILLSDATDHDNIVMLLAAVGDTTDPYCYTVDFLFPFYPFDLQDLLNSPFFTPYLVSSPPTPPPDEVILPSSRAFKPLASVQSFACAHSRDDYLTTVLCLSTQLLRAIAHLHAHGVSHRDIKPSNILISSTGQALLCDFGTAWEKQPLGATEHPGNLPDSLGRKARRRTEGSLPVPEVGTGPYRAPELLFSPSKGYDTTKVDIWAAAVTIAAFFREWTEVSSESADQEDRRDTHSYDNQDDARPDWEKQLWNDASGTTSWTSSIGASASATNDAQPDAALLASFHLPAIGAELQDDEEREASSPYDRPTSRREPLFIGTQGDIGLASSIFALTGFPNVQRLLRRSAQRTGRVHEADGDANEDAVDVWPEAVHFSPTLARMPFQPRPKGDLLSHLPLAVQLLACADADQSEDDVVHLSSRITPPDPLSLERLSILLTILDAALVLSASRRPTADIVMRQLEAVGDHASPSETLQYG